MKFYIPSEGKFTKDVPDDKIVGFVTNYPDAIPVAEEGAPPVQPPAPAAPATPQPETTMGGMLGGAVRAAALPATAAAVGAAMGAPAGGIGAVPGALAGAGTALLAQMVLDPAYGFINRVAGTDLVMPSQALQDFLTELGVPEPDTAAERLVQQATGGLASSLGGVGVGQALTRAATPLATPTAGQIVGRALAERPVEQAAAGAVGGYAGQVAAEMGGGPLTQAAASVLAGGTTAAVPSAARRGISTALESIGKEADIARVATAGKEAVKTAKKGLGGVDEVEMARVMRAANLGGVSTPKALAERALRTQKEAGGLIGSIIGEVDAQTAALMKQADEAQAKLAAAQDDLQKALADKVKAAEEAASKAAEIEKAAAAANARFESQKTELTKAAIQTKPTARPLPAAPQEPGTSKFNISLVEAQAKTEAAKQAEAEAARGLTSAQRTFQVLGPKEGEWPTPEPTSSQRRALWDLMAMEQQIQQTAEETASAGSRQKMLETALGVAPREPWDVAQLPMRSVVTAKKNLQSRQREVDMVNAAAKRAREEADRLAKEAQPTAEQQGAIDEAKATVERLTKEADKRMVDGNEIAGRLDAEARSVLARQNATTAEQLDDSNRATYDALTRSANQLRGRKLTLTEVKNRIESPTGGLARVAKFEKKGEIPQQGSALAAQGEISALRSAGDVAAEEALSAPGAQPPFMASPLASVGRGKPIAGIPTGKEGYQSGRRVYDVATTISESAQKEAERLAQKSYLTPFAASTIAGGMLGGIAGDTAGAFPGAALGAVGGKLLAEYGPSMVATGREAARRLAPQYAPSGPIPTAAERFLATLPYGAETFEEALRQIDEESAP